MTPLSVIVYLCSGEGMDKGGLTERGEEYQMKKRGIALLLCACLGLTGTMGTVRAQAAGSEESSSFQGENSDALEHVTGVDEEGNVYEVSDTERQR